MKIKMVIPLITALSVLQSCKQTVPKTVNDAFSHKYIGAKDVVWTKCPQHVWMATFYMEKFHYMTAYYNPNGDFEALELKIRDAGIPKNLVTEIQLDNPNAAIYDVFELSTEHTTDYLFEIEDKGKFFGIQFHENGVSEE